MKIGIKRPSRTCTIVNVPEKVLFWYHESLWIKLGFTKPLKMSEAFCVAYNFTEEFVGYIAQNVEVEPFYEKVKIVKENFG